MNELLLRTYYISTYNGVFTKKAENIQNAIQEFLSETKANPAIVYGIVDAQEYRS